MKNASGVTMSWTLVLLVILLLAGLPVAVWLDLSNLAETNLRRQASDLNSIISSVRGYYASNVVGRILAAPGTTTKVVHNYESVPGAIPDPGHAVARTRQGHQRAAAQHRLSVRLGLSVREPRAAYARRVRDRRACIVCAKIRDQALSDVSSSLFSDRVRLVAPVIMGAGLRQLPQRASRKPEARLEGRRRARHPGGHHHPADRRQHLSRSSTCWPISSSWPRSACCSSSCSAGRPPPSSGMNRSWKRPTSSSPRCR